MTRDELEEVLYRYTELTARAEITHAIDAYVAAEHERLARAILRLDPKGIGKFDAGYSAALNDAARLLSYDGWEQ